MKKLLLAPAVALAFAGLAAAPAVAAEPTDSQSTEATTTSANDASQTKDSAEPAGGEKAGGESAKDSAEEGNSSTPTSEPPKETEKPKPAKRSPAEGPDDGGSKAAGSGEDTADKGAEANEDGANDEKKGTQDVKPIGVSLQVSPGEITAENLADPAKGVTVTVKGVLKDDTVTNSLTGESETVESDGSATIRLRHSATAAEIEAGAVDFTVTVERDNASPDTAEGTINLVEEDDDADKLNASLTVVPEEITAADLANKDKGFEITVDGLRPGDTVEDSLTPDEPETVDGTSYSTRIFYDGDASQIEPGPIDFTVTVVRGEGEDRQEQVLKGTITVVGPKDDDKNDEPKDDGKDDFEAPAEASLSVTPKSIEAADFVNSKKGVTLTVTDCEAGADVHFMISPKGIDVTAYENTETADDEGTASVVVFGTTSDESAYVGDYVVTATCGGDTMKDSFSVTGGARSGGGDDNGYLPRTGTDLGGLTAGAILLLVGGAAVALTGRRKSAGQSPTDI
ncbi:hypothetical protein DFO66_11421 [Brevibacterium sanguinis]|uniref:LPXTG-motif cell wall-anchored protein n=2 Tax=Brevibacterium TaxID=1696 RepID=A0A366IGS7_9MICO|nr:MULTISPECIES: hypothetical protein [Brevibacterium]RBP62514.1 hypothetical protein DFO66_11421 [Brevibacterium sanguinis]RBP69178.1 hypothetical protein DFO65_11421 [Brevibacterium celere]